MDTMDDMKGKDGMEQISMLLDKYMDGETSNAEEARLRQYFATAGNDMPDEWRAYKALFRYEAEEIANMPAAIPSAGRPKARRRRMWMAGAASAATAAAMLVCLLTALPRGEKNYAVIDGKKYTDREVVMQEAEEALSIVSSSEDDTFEALEQLR